MAVTIKIQPAGPTHMQTHLFKMIYEDATVKGEISFMCNLTDSDKKILELFSERFLSSAIGDLVCHVAALKVKQNE